MNKLTVSMIAATFALGVSANTMANDDWAQDADPAYHGETDMGAEVTFEELDTTGDGYINQADVPADHELATLFAQYDVDGDGRLSREEFAAYSGEQIDSEPAE